MEQYCRAIQYHLLDVLGPLVGHASDGDSRRRKLHLANSNSNEGVRYKIKHPNFSYNGKLVKLNNQKFVVDFSDQDFIHNGKKLVNHLMHPSRVLSLGGNLCHMNYVQLIISNPTITNFQHELQQSDVDCPDRMNWESSQRLLFPKLRDCLLRINTGEVQPQEDVIGSINYLHDLRYVEIFYSLSASLLERVISASFVCNFLRIWRLWVYRTGALNLQQNHTKMCCFPVTM